MSKEEKPVTKLVDMKVTNVDFVGQGANQQADVLLFKSKDGGEMMEKAEAQGVMDKLAKMLGLKSEEPVAKSADSEPVAKANEKAVSFNDIQGVRVVREKMWDMNEALVTSILSIMKDPDVKDKQAAISKTVDEHAVAVKAMVGAYTNPQQNVIVIPKSEEGETKAEEVGKAAEPLDIGKGEPPAGKDEGSMKIQKEKLTAEEAAQLETLLAKCGETAEYVEKSAEAEVGKSGEKQDVFKGMSPELVGMFQKMQEKIDAQQAVIEKKADEELLAKAKEYELIGQKPEELAKSMKEWKSAGEESFNRNMAMLDSMLAIAKQSNMFTEIGKKGGDETGDAWARIEKAADEIQKSDAKMNRYQAIDKACQMHPELVKEYESR